MRHQEKLYVIIYPYEKYTTLHSASLRTESGTLLERAVCALEMDIYLCREGTAVSLCDESDELHGCNLVKGVWLSEQGLYVMADVRTACKS